MVHLSSGRKSQSHIATVFSSFGINTFTSMKFSSRRVQSNLSCPL